MNQIKAEIEKTDSDWDRREKFQDRLAKLAGQAPKGPRLPAPRCVAAFADQWRKRGWKTYPCFRGQIV